MVSEIKEVILPKEATVHEEISWIRHTSLTRGPHEPVSANWLFIQFVFNPVDILFENISKWNKTLNARDWIEHKLNE
jgi:hypothetical protein